MKSLLIALSTIALLGPGIARAQTVQLSGTRCAQFQQMSLDKKQIVVAWLVGYYTEEQDSDTFNEAQIADVQTKFDTFCATNPTFTLASAAEGLLTR